MANIDTDIGTIAEPWKLVCLQEVAEKPRYGYTASAAKNGDAKFLRITDITEFGVNWHTVPYCECSKTNLSKYELKENDILFARIGATTGKTCIVKNAPRSVFASYLIRVRVKNCIDADYLYFFLQTSGYWTQINSSKHDNLKKGVNAPILSSLLLPLPPLEEQRKIAKVLSMVQDAIAQQEQLITLTIELKKALMQKLFTEGTRGEPQKMTEIGLIPESWELQTIENVCDIKSSSMSYKQLENLEENKEKDSITVFGIKVSDMNLDGNEIFFNTANLKKLVDKKSAIKRTITANAIVFPKRGAAIATNKKRLTTCYTVLDPNLIAIICSEVIDCKFLFHWVNTFDLAKITDPGTTPQLNKKDIAPLKFPCPSKVIQEEISNYIDSLDAKKELHNNKLTVLTELFRNLLHQLMTAQIRVDDLNLSALNVEPQGGDE